MAYDINGTLHHVGPVQQLTERFKKREYVLLVPDGKYPQHIPCELTGDRVSLIDDMRIGDEIRATVNIRGREQRKPDGTVRYWLSLDTWKLERTSEAQPRGDDSSGSDDSLPF